VGYPFHFVPLIAFYYLLSPFLVRFARRFGLVLVVVIWLYQLVLINVVFPGTLGVTFPDWTRVLAPPVLGTALALWAIYFPLGLVYSINARHVLPWLERARWAFLIITVVFFVIFLLDVFSAIHFPLASFICPTTFVLFSTTIRRDSIPKVRTLEKLGRKSYGLYLTNLLFLDLVLFGIHLFAPGLFSYPVLLPPILFALTMGVALTAMDGFTRLPTRTMYRYVFG
jgi:peptidoglycan/LPS O-acetylase OafA/YrhL